MEEENPIIFFDGVCNLCNGAVNFIIDHDKRSQFKFAPLQSKTAEKYISSSVIENIDSILYWERGQLHTKSSAALRIAKKLDGLWKITYVFIIIPRFIRDFLYDQIAKNRYKWFGKRESCRMPTEDVKSRFLEMD